MWWIALSTCAAYAQDDGFDAYFATFQQAVAAKDREATAALTGFPFTSWDLVGKVPKKLTRGSEGGPVSLEHDAFVAAWPRLFDKEARAHVAAPNPVELGENGRGVGIWGGEDWAVWLVFERGEDGVWRLVGTDNVSG
ncbi:MAG: hypothetical protein H6738_02970 [Alphaproteobacteria bacterium]|nr:hypothetical protein [Alphaproteobacteria bacterium]MCB9695731.1 hypothetical protein [Alphaproteobacteria bacterium]